VAGAGAWIQRPRSLPKSGPTAATFPSGSISPRGWGACPGGRRERGHELQHRSRRATRHMRRRSSNHYSNAQPGTKEASPSRLVYRRSVPRPLGIIQAIGRFAPSTVSTDLVNPCIRSPLRRNGASRHQTIKAKAHCTNDPTTLRKPRAIDRTRSESSETNAPPARSSTSAMIFDPVNRKVESI